MRAVLLLCLLRAAVGQHISDEFTFSWDGPDPVSVTQPNPDPVCLLDQSSCGCCLIRKQTQRMQWLFNTTYEEMKKELTQTKTILNDMRATRSAFSVALNNDQELDCFGPFTQDRLIIYKHVFINLGQGYNMQNGIFTAPRSGVYSLSVTVHWRSASGTPAACASLLVNGTEVSGLVERNGQDPEDSSTIVAAVKLKAGDQVSVNLPTGCVVCDLHSHYNTFTGFLLYAD